MPTFATSDLDVVYEPILDVARGVAAGFQARPRVDLPRAGRSVLDLDGSATASVLAVELAAAPARPVDTFLSLPVSADVAASDPVREVLLGQPSLDGVVLELTGPLSWGAAGGTGARGRRLPRGRRADERRRPVTIIEHGIADTWDESDALAVNIETPLVEAVERAMTRPRLTRFTPLVCTDDAGEFVGILRIERLMAHLTEYR